MGAFIGHGNVGVWANNRERDAFFDWFADKRCLPGDERWEYCKSPAHRYSGYGFELTDLLPKGVRLNLSKSEQMQAATEYWPHMAQLLEIIDAISRGDWLIENGDTAAENWRSGEGPEREVYERLGLLND